MLEQGLSKMLIPFRDYWENESIRLTTGKPSYIETYSLNLEAVEKGLSPGSVSR